MHSLLIVHDWQEGVVSYDLAALIGAFTGSERGLKKYKACVINLVNIKFEITSIVKTNKTQGRGVYSSLPPPLMGSLSTVLGKNIKKGREYHVCGVEYNFEKLYLYMIRLLGRLSSWEEGKEDENFCEEF